MQKGFAAHTPVGFEVVENYVKYDASPKSGKLCKSATFSLY